MIQHSQATNIQLTVPKRLRGFTLIELLIVMVILGILTTIVASSFRSSQEKAHDSRRKNDLESLAKALELYFTDNGRYPQSSNGEIVVSNCGADGADACNWGGEFTDARGTLYMAKIPQETASSYRFYYVTDATQQQYALFARLENEEDKDIPRDQADEIQYYQGTNCGSSNAGCNYAISSAGAIAESFFALADDTGPTTPETTPEATSGPTPTPTPGPTPTPPTCTDIYYADTDGDGYGSGTGVALCSPTAGYVANNTDCYDGNANAYPNSEYCGTTNRGDGSFDYNCSSATTKCGTEYYPRYWWQAYYWDGDEEICGDWGFGYYFIRYPIPSQSACGATGYRPGSFTAFTVPPQCFGSTPYQAYHTGASGTQACQ